MKSVGIIRIKTEKGAFKSSPAPIYAENEEGKYHTDFHFIASNDVFECILPLTADNVIAATPFWGQRKYSVSVEQKPVEHPFNAAEQKKWKAADAKAMEQERAQLVDLEKELSEVRGVIPQLDGEFSNQYAAYRNSCDKAQDQRQAPPQKHPELIEARKLLDDVLGRISQIEGSISMLKGNLL